jgi:hypothetical protein
MRRTERLRLTWERFARLSRVRQPPESMLPFQKGSLESKLESSVKIVNTT